MKDASILKTLIRQQEAFLRARIHRGILCLSLFSTCVTQLEYKNHGGSMRSFNIHMLHKLFRKIKPSNQLYTALTAFLNVI